MPRPKGSKNKSKAASLHEAYAITPHPRKGWPKGKKRGPRKVKYENPFERHQSTVFDGISRSNYKPWWEGKNQSDPKMRPENQDIRVNQMLKNLMPRSEREMQYINDALEGTGMFFCAFEGREYLINQDKKKIIYTV